MSEEFVQQPNENDSQAAPAPAEADHDVVPMPPEESHFFKQKSVGELRAMFHNIATFVGALPVHEVMRQHAFFNMDQAMLWLQEAINSMQITQKLVKKAPAAEQANEPTAAS